MQNFILTADKIRDNIDFFRNNSEEDYCKMVQKIILSNPFKGNKFYIFQFPKRVDDNSGIKKMYHQARLTKPEPLPGTTLLRCDPRNPDEVEILWTLPQKENFNLYTKGKMFADPFVHECIEKYNNNREEMCRPETDDLSDREIREIYKSMKKQEKYKFS